MWEVGVVVVDPFVDGDFEVKRVIPIVAPDNVFFDRAHDPFSIRIALRVGPSGKDLFEPKNRAVHHEALRCWLTAVVGY